MCCVQGKKSVGIKSNANKITVFTLHLSNFYKGRLREMSSLVAFNGGHQFLSNDTLSSQICTPSVPEKLAYMAESED